MTKWLIMRGVGSSTLPPLIFFKALFNNNLLLYKSHYVYLIIYLFIYLFIYFEGRKPTTPTVLNVDNSKLVCRMVIQFPTT